MPSEYHQLPSREKYDGAQSGTATIPSRALLLGKAQRRLLKIPIEYLTFSSSAGGSIRGTHPHLARVLISRRTGVTLTASEASPRIPHFSLFLCPAERIARVLRHPSFLCSSASPVSLGVLQFKGVSTK
jgi:hypothetical protein